MVGIALGFYAPSYEEKKTYSLINPKIALVEITDFSYYSKYITGYSKRRSKRRTLVYAGGGAIKSNDHDLKVCTPAQCSARGGRAAAMISTAIIH